MTKIGLISDTHGYLDQKIFEYFRDCNEIWHAGDIGNIETAEILSRFKLLRAVSGNIDSKDVCLEYPEHQRFFCEDVDIWITHIGGYPDKYASVVKKRLYSDPPGLFICGHSHILKVIFDKKLNLLHINPGSSGKFGLHNVRTAVRFNIDNKDIKDLEVIELGRRI